jgi:hypothetical protein
VQASGRIAENIANFLPGVVVFCFIVLVAVLVAMCARFITVRLMRRVAIDDRAREFGLDVVGEWSSTRPPSLVVGRLVFWLIVTMGLLVALTALDATIPNPSPSFSTCRTCSRRLRSCQSAPCWHASSRARC